MAPPIKLVPLGSKKWNSVPKPKEKRRVMKQPTRNWVELPSDLTLNILQRLGVSDVFENAEKVCTAWREICKDPAMWRVIYMDQYPSPTGPSRRETCRLALDRSQGQLVDITIIGFCDPELLYYVTDRSSQLRRLEIKFPLEDLYGSWGEAFKKVSLLEELSGAMSPEDIEAAGRYCPLLKTLKVNLEGIKFGNGDNDEVEDHDMYEDSMTIKNETALAIGKNLPELTHLELIGNTMDNTGLQAILDGCRHLESLDLRRCFCVDLKGDLGKRCSQQIKHLKLPNDSLKGCSNIFKPYYALANSDDEVHDCFKCGHQYYGYSNYDDYTAYDNNDDDDDNAEDDEDDGDRIADLYLLHEMMAFMDMYR